jgi:hypothetical protein
MAICFKDGGNADSMAELQTNGKQNQSRLADEVGFFSLAELS